MTDMGWALAFIATLLAMLLYLSKPYETRKLETPVGSFKWEEHYDRTGSNPRAE